ARRRRGSGAHGGGSEGRGMNPASFLRKLLGGGQSGVERRTRDLLALCESLLSERGEYASTALARDAMANYEGLDERSREEFFEMLARHYSPSAEAVSRVAADYQADPSPENLARLQETA